ncbi:hypothetical protein QR680_010977 [Steinernema hermaphroditum]|uniref:Uncharacterized protein n=1 Tax=Steinernema hermaphroditum TaxID=289476 RepID=A0AA39MC23_9BILA|nr:hypothetical protein QR680_010977 [Steinernema hermaphroditum]
MRRSIALLLCALVALSTAETTTDEAPDRESETWKVGRLDALTRDMERAIGTAWDNIVGLKVVDDLRVIRAVEALYELSLLFRLNAVDMGGFTTRVYGNWHPLPLGTRGPSPKRNNKPTPQPVHPQPSGTQAPGESIYVRA